MSIWRKEEDLLAILRHNLRYIEADAESRNPDISELRATLLRRIAATEAATARQVELASQGISPEEDSKKTTSIN